MKLRFCLLTLVLGLMCGMQVSAQQPGLLPKVKISMDQHCFHFYFSGKVQGVYFRATSQEFARELDLRGWVRNLEDGRVEMQAQGRPSDLKRLLDRLDERFEISEVEKHAISCRGSWGEFEVLR